MDSNRIMRIIAGLLVAVVSAASASWMGADAGPALLALIGGAIATTLAWAGSGTPPAADPATGPTEQSPLPDAINLVESVDTPLLVIRNRRVLLANAAARELLGAHIEGVDVRLAIRHPAAAESLIRDDPERVVRIDLVGLGQHDRRWHMTATLLKDGSRVVRLIDASALQSAEQMRVDFVANASHELRTPLATLLGFLETLQDEAAAEDKGLRTRFLGIMSDEAKRMHRLVDDLISLSRIEAERFRPPSTPVDLLSVAEEVRKSCAHVAEDRGSEITVDKAAGVTKVMGDAVQLHQLVQNLVGNALKYGRPGTPVKVLLSDAGPAMLRLSVTDQGEGIAAHHLPRLTERFYRVDPGRSRAMGGTGLGLAIVKHIVSRHRGRLDIRSNVGEGTTVAVDLPRSPDALSSKSHESVTEDSRNVPNKAPNAG